MTNEIKCITLTNCPSCHLQYYQHSGGGVVEIVDLFVSEQLRRKRIGTSMMNILVGEVRKKDTKTHLIAVTRASNQVAITFYKELGMEERYRLSNFYIDKNITSDAVVMGAFI